VCPDEKGFTACHKQHRKLEAETFSQRLKSFCAANRLSCFISSVIKAKLSVGYICGTFTNFHKTK